MVKVRARCGVGVRLRLRLRLRRLGEVNTSARERMRHSASASSASKTPSSQSDWVTESGIATTLPMDIISTKMRRNSGSGLASGRRAKASAAYKNMPKRPSSASIQPSLAKTTGLRPRPSDTTESSGIRTAFIIALNARMSPSLITPTQATTAPMTYCRKRLAIALKLLSRIGAKLELDIAELR